jgi:hypothetical protein
MTIEAGQERSSAAERSRAGHLADLGMQARYHRDRHRLYAARMGGSRPWSPSKLRELKRLREVAESALGRAKHHQREVAESTSQGSTPNRLEKQP